MTLSPRRRRMLKWWRRINWVVAALWVALIYPTLTWWPDSVTWVALMSLWANIAAHVAAALAAED